MTSGAASRASRKQDAEANAFALEFLMPEAAVREEAARIGVVRREELTRRLAHLFDVLPEHMSARLHDLGIIS